MNKEHSDMMAVFERTVGKGRRLDREDKAIWTRGCIYQDGAVNELFLAFRAGFALAKSMAQQGWFDEVKQ